MFITIHHQWYTLEHDEAWKLRHPNVKQLILDWAGCCWTSKQFESEFYSVYRVNNTGIIPAKHKEKLH